MPEDKETLKVDMGAEGVKSVTVSFPPNSHKSREARVAQQSGETKKIEKVTTGKVVTKKKSLGKRFLETFTGDDMDNVMSYIVHDVLIPAAKSAINDMVQGGIEMILYGEKRGNRTKRENGRSYVSYNNYSSGRRDERDNRDRREFSQRDRARHNFDEIIFSSRVDAEKVLSDLVDLTLDYQQATVSDLYDLVGITANFTDNKYGWTDLRSATVSRVRDGYQLNLPRTILLE